MQDDAVSMLLLSYSLHRARCVAPRSYVQDERQYRTCRSQHIMDDPIWSRPQAQKRKLVRPNLRALGTSVRTSACMQSLGTYLVSKRRTFGFRLVWAGRRTTYRVASYNSFRWWSSEILLQPASVLTLNFESARSLLHTH